MGSFFFPLRQKRLHTFLSQAPAPTLIFPQQHLCTYLFRECTGCHGNGAQVGRGELGGTLRPPRRATDIKRIGGPFWGGEESERASETKRKRELKRAREEASQRGSVQARKWASTASGACVVSDHRQQRDNSSFPVLEQVSMWCACGCQSNIHIFIPADYFIV